MKTTLCAVLIAALTPSLWGQKERRVVDLKRITEPAGKRSKALALNRRAVREVSKDGQRAISVAALGQAPGVVQFNLFDQSHVVWFVTTAAIPKGTLITPYLVLANDVEVELDTLRMTEDLAAGESFDLPNIRKFSEFWPEGLLTYVVVVNANGVDTQSAADFPVGSFRNYADMNEMVPRMSSWSQSLEDRNVVLSLKGVYTSGRVQAAIEDLPVPQEAITASGSEIRINLSRVPYIDLALVQEFLVTVGQDGWCDTIIVRYSPPAPGTYNPAPSS